MARLSSPLRPIKTLNITSCNLVFYKENFIKIVQYIIRKRIATAWSIAALTIGLQLIQSILIVNL